MGRYRGTANKDVALSVYTAAIRQWITAPLLFLIRIKIRTAHKPRLEPCDTRSAASYQEFDRTLPRARLVVLRVAELPSHALMLSGMGHARGHCGLDGPFHGMLRCLRREDHVGKSHSLEDF